MTANWIQRTHAQRRCGVSPDCDTLALPEAGHSVGKSTRSLARLHDFAAGSVLVNSCSFDKSPMGAQLRQTRLRGVPRTKVVQNGVVATSTPESSFGYGVCPFKHDFADRVGIRKFFANPEDISSQTRSPFPIQMERACRATPYTKQTPSIRVGALRILNDSTLFSRKANLPLLGGFLRCRG
jgi:hypothetical protein